MPPFAVFALYIGALLKILIVWLLVSRWNCCPVVDIIRYVLLEVLSYCLETELFIVLSTRLWLILSAEGIRLFTKLFVFLYFYLYWICGYYIFSNFGLGKLCLRKILDCCLTIFVWEFELFRPIVTTRAILRPSVSIGFLTYLLTDGKVP